MTSHSESVHKIACSFAETVCGLLFRDMPVKRVSVWSKVTCDECRSVNRGRRLRARIEARAA